MMGKTYQPQAKHAKVFMFIGNIFIMNMIGGVFVIDMTQVLINFTVVHGRAIITDKFVYLNRMTKISSRVCCIGYET